MIKVILVDDEIAIREGIRNSFPWEDSGYTLVGEAPDGEIALPLIRDENPDILITDIRMPFMDGMELCREVKRTMPWISIVILSGHDDFDYARQAISLGVQEYLLKPITASELKAVLDRISLRMREERSARESVESMRRRLASGNRFVKDKLLSSLFMDAPDEANSMRMIEQLRSLGINLAANCYTVLDIAFEFPGGTREPGMDVLYKLAESSGGSVQVCTAKRGARALIMGGSEADTEERAYAFAASAVYGLEDCEAQDILITIGEMVEKLTDVVQSMKSARHIRHVLARSERCKTMRIVGAREVEDQPNPLPDLDFRPLTDRLRYVTAEAFPSVFNDYAASLSAMGIHSSVLTDYMGMEALITAAAIVREAGGDPEDVLHIKQYESTMIPGEGLEDLESARQILLKALRYRDSNSPMHGHSAIAEARYYLSEHFTDPNLMLQDVASAVCMSNSRFSTVFSQETGHTFTEYLTALRMSKARELLTATTMRSSQIGYAVGYSDPHYFSYLFKKNTGMTPSEYRRRQNENKPS